MTSRYFCVQSQMFRHLFRPFLLTAVLFGAVVGGVKAQSHGEARFYPEQLRQDLETIRQTMHQAHPDPYRYHTRSEVDRLLDTISAGFQVPLTQEEFLQAMMPLFKFVGDGNTQLGPSAALTFAYGNTEPLVPLVVSVLEDGLFVNEELKGFRTLPAGTRIVAINGVEGHRIVERLRAGVVGDGRDTTYLDRRIEREFPVLHRRYFGATTTFDVDVELPTGERAQRRVFSLTGEEMARSYVPKGVELKAWRMEEMPDLGTTWVTLASMDRKELTAQGITPERFLSSVEEAMRRAGTRTLVIDVRGADGPDAALAEQVFALIAQAPYRVMQTMKVRSRQVPDAYKYSAPMPEFFASLSTSYLPEQDGSMSLRPDDPRLTYLDPLPRAFKGKVYVLADGAVRNAAAAFVMMAVRSGRVTFIGEELGTNALSYCGGRELTVTLPRTRCILRVPLTRYVPEGTVNGPVDRGELPRYSVSQRRAELAQGRDAVRSSLLLMLRELQ